MTKMSMLLGAVVACWLLSATSASADPDPVPVSNAPAGYDLIWQDEFKSLLLRGDGGPWESFGGNSRDFKGQPGFGYDYFANPDWSGWPASVQDLRIITPEGLRLRAREATPAEAKLMPPVHGVSPWISSSLGSFDRLNFKPPFYIEFRAKMPSGSAGQRPWPALWLYTNPRQRPPFSRAMKAYELDLHEGFGNSAEVASNLHWDTGEATPYRAFTITGRALSIDLSSDFHMWGASVTSSESVIYFDGHEIGRVKTPPDADGDQPMGISMNVSAGIPWKEEIPKGGPYDMFVRYVRLYAPNTHGFSTGH